MYRHWSKADPSLPFLPLHNLSDLAVGLTLSSLNIKGTDFSQIKSVDGFHLIQRCSSLCKFPLICIVKTWSSSYVLRDSSIQAISL